LFPGTKLYRVLYLREGRVRRATLARPTPEDAVDLAERLYGAALLAVLPVESRSPKLQLTLELEMSPGRVCPVN
jgi:hypothetical protein